MFTTRKFKSRNEMRNQKFRTDYSIVKFILLIEKHFDINVLLNDFQTLYSMVELILVVIAVVVGDSMIFKIDKIIKF